MAESEEPENIEETETPAGTETESAGTETEASATAPEPAEEAPAGESAPEAADAAAAAPAEPEEIPTPKERRRRARTAKAAGRPARGPRSAEERQQEREEARTRKAGQRRTSRARARAKADHSGAERTPPRERVPGTQKVRQGVVVSDKADKTITVRIDTARRHRRYSKIVRTSNTLHAHDESNDANVGDTVIVREARPLSRTKRWRLVQVVERAR
jgi:small subunit ribosomal protein S17